MSQRSAAAALVQAGEAPQGRVPAEIGAATDRVGERHPQSQLDLEQHGGRTFEGVAVRVTQRVLALAAAIWHNHKTG
ncbi:hypothetical protein SSAG_00517 [Streptomyces sp. Mg1]|nr:hypothetical protein SSAG_00517 [Streptomyces sp. Mg1]